MNPIIKAENLTKTYKLSAEDINAVKDVNLEVSQGDYIAIMGPSGSGKTTLLDMLGCLDSISNGWLTVLDKDVSDLKESKLVEVRREHFGFIFQDFLLLPGLSALDNVRLPSLFNNDLMSRDSSKELLEKVGLGHRINHLPRELSGGERQRVAIARALASNPKILIADEPTGNLDSANSKHIYDVFDKLNKQDGLTIIVATHDTVLGQQAKRIVSLRDGMIS